MLNPQISTFHQNKQPDSDLLTKENLKTPTKLQSYDNIISSPSQSYCEKSKLNESSNCNSNNNQSRIDREKNNDKEYNFYEIMKNLGYSNEKLNNYEEKFDLKVIIIFTIFIL